MVGKANFSWESINKIIRGWKIDDVLKELNQLKGMSKSKNFILKIVEDYYLIQKCYFDNLS
jgi:hypothetical protein